MEQVLARPVLPPMAARKLSQETIATLIGAGVVLLLGVGGGAWVVSEKIGDVREQLRGTMQGVETRLGQRIDEVGKRVSDLEARFGSLDAGLRAERETRSQERGELQQRIGGIQKDQQQTEQRVAAVARTNAERVMALMQVVQLESRILPGLRPNTRTMPGTLLSFVPAERVLAIETADGKSRSFIIADDVVTKAFCGTHEEQFKLSDLKRGVAVLVAYDMVGGRGTARVVVKSACA